MRRLATAVFCVAALFCLFSALYFWTVAAFLANDATRPRAIYDIKAWLCLFGLSVAVVLAIWKTAPPNPK